MEDRPLEDGDLVARARGGDADAYEELVRRHQASAIRVAYAISGSAAEDAVQEAFVKAYGALGRFREGAAFRPWLFRIVANEAKNRLRSAGRSAQLALRAARDPASGGAVPSPEATVLEDELRRNLIEAMRSLRADDREVLAYRFFLDLSEADMAQALGVPRGTVKSRLSRAIRRLRALVEERGMKDG